LHAWWLSVNAAVEAVVPVGMTRHARSDSTTAMVYEACVLAFFSKLVTLQTDQLQKVP